LTTTAQADADSAGVGRSVALSASVAEDDASVTYQWVQTFGPGVAIVDANRAAASFVARSYARDEVLTFIVLTRNAAGDVGRAEVSVTVAADPDFGASDEPVARAGGDRDVAPGASVTLDGTASSGVDLDYSWRQVSGGTVALTNATQARASFTAPALASGDAGANEYIFELTVRDDMARVSADRVTITVSASAEPTDPTGGKPRVRMTIIRDEGRVTPLGDIVIELENVLAPKTVNNFLQYVDDGFYDGLLIHRVIADFVIQGGGYRPDLTQAEPRDAIESEADNGLSNTRATIAMALFGTDADSATSQWFINLGDNSDLDAPNAPPFTVFGRVVEGMDVVDAIAAIPTANKGLPPNQLQDVPIPDIIMQTVRREPSAGGGG
jgi:cyclophilin family peptidyl-prolyl cis-trans isomerase